MRKKASKERKTIETNAAALRLLRSPQFLFSVGNQIGVGGVVGEHRSRLVLYLACLTSALKKVVSVLIKGPTSTGKNNLLKGVLSLIPPELVLTRSSFSKKALAYGADDLAGKILYLVEHRGGRDAQIFMRLLQSEGALQHEATNISGGKRETDVAIRPSAPVFLSTTTDERVFEDDETRFLSLRADESSELTREVLRAQFRENRDEDESTEPFWPVCESKFPIIRVVSMDTRGLSPSIRALLRKATPTDRTDIAFWGSFFRVGKVAFAPQHVVRL